MIRLTLAGAGMARVMQRRRGGRQARRAERSRPASERAVRGGLEGGRYAPLSENELRAIHEAALDILETVGLADPVPSCVELCTRRGAELRGHGRLCFPRGLVEKVIAAAARDFPLCGRHPEHDIRPGGNRVHFATAGAAVHIVDARSGRYRESTLADLYDAARIVDTLEHLHLFQRPLVCRDLEDPFEMEINTLYACLAGTRKHVGVSFTHPRQLEAAVEMLHLLAGSGKAFRARPFVSLSCCFVVPPLRFAEDACRCLEAAVRAGFPVLLLAAGQAGATSPAALAGAVTQAIAEVLAGLVYVHCIRPGAPALLGPWPFVSDLRTGAMSGGSGEQALLMAACAQMGRFYDIPTGVASGMTDSKLCDEQAGYEIGINHALVANAGANIVYEAAGMRASLLGFSLEGLVIDHDAIGAVLRTLRGVEVAPDSLSVEVVREVCLSGPGHFLGHEQTLALMQKDYLYPLVGDRSSPREWTERGAPTVLDRAIRVTEETLRRHRPHYIDRGIDEQIRRRLPIRLPAPTGGEERWGRGEDHR